MKKIYLLLFTEVLLLSIGFISCSKDDDVFEDISSDGNVNANVQTNGHDYVDLGLSTLWATCNIGAYSSTQMGNKYAYGETSVKSEYTSSNYIGGNGDIAKIIWGGDWRMPTSSELSEIVSGCTWRVKTKNGIEVVTATGPNGNSIDFPYYSYIGNSGLAGWYWSATSYTSSKAYCLHFENDKISYGTNNKYNGFLVRAVITNPNYNGSSNNNGNNNSGGAGGSSDSYEKPDVGFYDFTATKTSLKVQYKIYNKDEAGVTSAKIYYGTSSNPSSSKTATISGTLITANISGLKAGTEYYVKCVATGKGGTTTTSVTKCITNY